MNFKFFLNLSTLYVCLVLNSMCSASCNPEIAGEQIPSPPKGWRGEHGLPPPPPSQGPIDAARYDYSLKARELAWREKVNSILFAEILKNRQHLSNLICYFSVEADGSIVNPVKFSRNLSSVQSKNIEKRILAASPLPQLPGNKRKKIYFEVVKENDTYVNFVE